MKALSIPLGFALLTGMLPGLSHAIDLQPATLRAWNEYIESADAGMQARLDGQRKFLWADEAPERITHLQHGKTLVAPVVGHGTQNVPNGLIHHWIGAVFIPNATIKTLLAVIRDYDRYKDFYKPVVADSRTLACSDEDQRFSMVWQHRVLFVNAAIAGQYRAHEVVVDERRGYNIATTTEVREIESYGQDGEHFLAPGQGNGFIWRLQSIARYEERDGGVYLELEAIALTRDIPASLRWLVSGVVNHLSINSLATTLRQTREAVSSLAAGPERLASCGGSVPRAASVKAAGEN
jgi:hypothetical protein